MPETSVTDVMEIERERRDSYVIDDIPKAGTFPNRKKYPGWLLLNHGTIVITDKKTKEPVFIVRFTRLDKLREDTQEFDKLQRVFQFHMKSIPLLYPIKLNGAHKRAGGGGVIVGHGYRKGYEKGYLFGKYHPNYKIQQDPVKIQQWLQLQNTTRSSEISTMATITRRIAKYRTNLQRTII